MTAQQQKVGVNLGERSYDIMIEDGLLARAGAAIRGVKPKGAAFVVTDANVQALHAKALLQSLAKADIAAKIFAVAPGEASKNFATLATLAGDLIDAGITRGDFIIAFGGGVIGDLAGFAASIILRGVDFIQIPTTLLAQVDSSVGGKTGINLAAGKNLVGSFHQPKLVLIDPNVLDTLEARQQRAGYAEIAKIALIGDEQFFAWLEKNSAAIFKNTPERAQAIETACRMKAGIVERDEYEQGERALLNLGHTFGHALEALTHYSDALLHGEAVAIGIAMAHQFSAQLGLCGSKDMERAIAHLENAGLPVSPKNLPGVNPEKLLAAMLKDKKMTNGQITLILSRGIGKAFVSKEVDSSALATFLQTWR